MRKDIHPKYVKSVIKCVCGNVVETMSVKPEMHIEICSACHPFYTGNTDRSLDMTGRVEKFKKKFEKFNEPEKKKKSK